MVRVAVLLLAASMLVAGCSNKDCTERGTEVYQAELQAYTDCIRAAELIDSTDSSGTRDCVPPQYPSADYYIQICEGNERYGRPGY